MGPPHKGQNVPKSPQLLNTTEHCLGKAWVGRWERLSQDLPQAIGPRAGAQSPREQDLPLLQPASHGGGAQKHVPKPALPS